jgi:holo-[acyl-carrier protein] synthase
MPLRVGLDLCSVDSVRDALDAHGDRYLDRVYHPGEISDSSVGEVLDAERLAGRFAAKEATFKVLRVGDAAVSWRDVEVIRDPTGVVELMLRGNAANLAAKAGISGLVLSLSHERGLAAAVVVAEICEPADNDAT